MVILNIQNSHLCSFEKFNFELFNKWTATKKMCCLRICVCNTETNWQLQMYCVQRPISPYSIKVLTKYTAVKSSQCQIFPQQKIAWVSIQRLIERQMSATLFIQQHACWQCSIIKSSLCTTINLHPMKNPANIR